MRLSLIVPCFNEAESVPELLVSLDGTFEELSGLGHTLEVMLVDDGSRDETPALLRAGTTGRPWLRVLRLARNYGQTAAMAAGIREASGEVILMMDADLQNDPRDIPALLARLDEGYDVVSGWRSDRKDSFLRSFVSRIANRIIAGLTAMPLHDFGCTLKAYRADSIRGVHLYGEMHRFLPIWAAWNGGRVAELKVRHHPRKHGTSKYGFGRVPNVILDLLLVRLLWSYGTKPIHVFGKFGLASIATSFLIFLLMIWFKFWGGKSFVETPLPLMATTFFLTGCLAILTGFLAEITMRIYYEAAGNPTYIVREEYRDGARATRQPNTPVLLSRQA